MVLTPSHRTPSPSPPPPSHQPHSRLLPRRGAPPSRLQVIETPTLAHLDIDILVRTTGLSVGRAADLLSAARAQSGTAADERGGGFFWFKAGALVGMLAVGSQLWVLHRVSQLLSTPESN